MSTIPKEYDKYRWRVSDTDPYVRERHAAGVERIVDYSHRYVRGQDYMYLGVDLSLAYAISSTDFLHAARRAWATLRFDIPIVAGTTTITAEDDTLIVYRAAPHHAAVEAWAERTVKLTEATTLSDARIEIDRRRPTIPDERGEQTFLYVVPRGSETEYAVILYGSHVPFDGVGYQAVMTRYLVILARYLSENDLADREHAGLKWGDEVKNLVPPYFEVIAETEPLEGPLFECSMGEVMQQVGTIMPYTHAFKSRDAPGGPDAPRRLEHIFSEEETTRIVRYSKTKGLTVNHLVHAAIALSSLVDNPSPAEGALFVNTGIYNARERLRPPYSERLRYTGTATVASFISVPVTAVLGIQDPQERLDVLSSALKPQYVQQRAFPALLGIGIAMVEKVIPFMKNTPPQAGRSVPRFAADGIGEWNLDPDYADAAGKHVFGVTDFFLCPRVIDSNAWFRAHTWRGRLKLSCDHNAAALPTEAAESFIRTVIELLTKVARLQ